MSVLGNDVTVPTAEMRNSRLHNITRCLSSTHAHTAAFPLGMNVTILRRIHRLFELAIV